MIFGRFLSKVSPPPGLAGGIAPITLGVNGLFLIACFENSDIPVTP